MLPLMHEMSVRPAEMRCDRAVSDATIAALTAGVALDSAMKQRNGPTSLRAGLRGRTRHGQRDRRKRCRSSRCLK
jgi:hypothetical protein